MKSKELVKHFEDKNIRMIIRDGILFFAANDVCNVLEIKNSRQAVSFLEKDDVISNDGIDTIGRKIEMTYITEEGLYDLILRSRKKEARLFRKWITHEVIPSIRKTGQYSIPEKIKKESTKNRNLLTDAWKNCGISKPKEYQNLTLTEYRSLGFDKFKRKHNMSRSEILLLNALEAMETLKLYHEPVEGFDECKSSLENTAIKIIDYTKKKELA